MLSTLYALAMLVLLVYGLNLLWLAVAAAGRERLLPGPVPDPEALPEAPPVWPLVTVQLPVYNEPYVVERLLDACAGLDYPRHGLEIQLLDDSTDETTALAARRVAFWRARGLDVAHVHRSERAGYKAGALQHGLLLARGEFVAIFDADFLPPPDFLKRTLPLFADPALGLVQARWGHLNGETSLVTRLQTLGLDAHFAVEQQVRNATGCFMNFNGTAGVWRRSCIEEAGGWASDTLAEDLDLSYRAQLAGWRFRYLQELEVPAELPADIDGLRAQQFRWTKGAVETARKMLGRLWRSPLPLGVRLEGVVHLTAPVVFPFVLLAALLHAPLVWRATQGLGPGRGYFALMALGLAGFLGFCLAQLFAQRALYPDWGARLARLPLFVAGTMGIALSNTRAVWQALRGRPSPFVRTPKYSDGTRTSSRAASGAPGRSPRVVPERLPAIVWAEAACFVYCLAGLGLLAAAGAWAAVPFQLLFTLGFGLVTLANVQQRREMRQSSYGSRIFAS